MQSDAAHAAELGVAAQQFDGTLAWGATATGEA